MDALCWLSCNGMTESVKEDMYCIARGIPVMACVDEGESFTLSIKLGNSWTNLWDIPCVVVDNTSVICVLSRCLKDGQYKKELCSCSPRAPILSHSPSPSLCLSPQLVRDRFDYNENIFY